VEDGSVSYSSGDLQTGSIAVGAWVSTGSKMNGLIDEVRIYNRALSPTEVAEHYTGIFTDETGLVLNLPMDEVEGDAVYDKSPSANHGILGPDYPADSPIRLLGNPALDCNIKIKFSAPPAGQRNQPVEFTVKDTANYSCSETKILGIRFPLPEYKEVSPVSWLKNFFASLLPEW
ncbi:MAG: LamG-like jellyroll fold domain-containing protein, partial [bacterium]|nr:LamG-like jellyroll fold domain-containing protein [bacterium]